MPNPVEERDHEERRVVRRVRGRGEAIHLYLETSTHSSIRRPHHPHQRHPDIPHSARNAELYKKSAVRVRVEYCVATSLERAPIGREGLGVGGSSYRANEGEVERVEEETTVQW